MSNDSECIFCKIVAGEIPSFKIYEDEHTLAFMDINPANEGHALAIPKMHATDVHEVPDEVLARTAVTAKRVAGAIERTLHPRGLNLIQANGPAAGQSVFHFHIHLMPRRKGDDLKLNWGFQPGDMEAIGALAERIKDNVE